MSRDTLEYSPECHNRYPGGMTRILIAYCGPLARGHELESVQRLVEIGSWLRSVVQPRQGRRAMHPAVSHSMAN